MGGSMTQLDINSIKNYINDANMIDSGKEVDVYSYNAKVIKIFHKERKTDIHRINDEGLKVLSYLPLQVFNKPIDLIHDKNDIIGYTENKLSEEELDKDHINYDEIYNDIVLLSLNGFRIEDIFYNYIYSNNRLYFTDLTCFDYINTDNAYVKKLCYYHNIEKINIFLIGLLQFDAFKKDEKNEYTKIYKANRYRLDNHINEYYGDYVSKNI